jgi:FHS family L-fucose permease-like MFS transporter
MRFAHSAKCLEATAGFLCTAIVGGAFLPLAAGAISDAFGYSRSFVLPAACYVALCGFALAATRAALQRGDAGGAAPTSLH